MSRIQRVFKLILPRSAFRKTEDESKKWMITCYCGFSISYWEAGGLSEYASRKNSKRIFGHRPNCKKFRFFKVTKKD
jgi:hypothetical protein